MYEKAEKLKLAWHIDFSEVMSCIFQHASPMVPKAENKVNTKKFQSVELGQRRDMEQSFRFEAWDCCPFSGLSPLFCIWSEVF
jgi:hypothetical protein